MRTTLTLDDDIAVLLRKEMARKHLSLKVAVNDALRRGLLTVGSPTRKRYKMKVFKTGPARVPFDNVADALAHAEGEAFR